MSYVDYLRTCIGGIEYLEMLENSGQLTAADYQPLTSGVEILPELQDMG